MRAGRSVRARSRGAALRSDGPGGAAAADAEWKIREERMANAGGAAQQDCSRSTACDDDPGQAKNCATPHDGIITNDPDGRNARLGEFSKCVATYGAGLPSVGDDERLARPALGDHRSRTPHDGISG